MMDCQVDTALGTHTELLYFFEKAGIVAFGWQT